MDRMMTSGALGLLVAAWLAGAAAAAAQPQPGRFDLAETSRGTGSVTIIPDPADEAPPPAISTARLALLNSTVKAENGAGVSVDLIPGLDVTVGSKIGFRITTRRSGYLILVNIDASGRLTQIFPAPGSIGQGAHEVSNFIRSGRPLTLPGPAHAGFEFVAGTPAGVAMAIALLSDKRVQVVDLPDAPPPVFAPGDTLKFVRDQARILRIAGPDGTQPEPPTWSFDCKFYVVR